MCFSAAASFIASGTIGTVGVAAIRRVRKPRDLAIAVVPIMFSIQQALEGVVWLSLNQPFVNLLATIGYLLFAYAFWPVFIPWCVRLIEPSRSRRRILLPFMAGGMLVGLYGLWMIFFLPAHTVVINQSLQYHVPEQYGVFGAMYVLTVCGSCLLSTSKWIVAAGALITLALVIALLFSFETVASVWCFYAALLSVLVFFHLRSPRSAA